MRISTEADAWLSANRPQLGSPFEEAFIRDVLARVPGIDWRCVTAQHPFLDVDGRQRYCDFVIREGDAVRIAIEVDGYDKTGRGQGMSRAEFADWQRRHASLVSQGWDVIRFANGDVASRPDTCIELLSLLLRRERARHAHVTRLAERRSALEQEVAALRAESAEASRLRAELSVTTSLATLANQARALSPTEARRLDELAAAQASVQHLSSENGIMKTTIWAFTALACVLLVLLFTRRGGEAESAAASVVQAIPVAREAAPVASGVTGESCARPLPWREAVRRIGTTAAFEGPVTRLTTREDVRGAPTWIDIGGTFPSTDRIGVVLWRADRARHQASLERVRVGTTVCVIGQVTLRQGVPQIVLGKEAVLAPM